MLRLLARLFVGLVLFSLLWVVAYRWLGPPATSLMLRDRMAGIEVSHRPVPLSGISINLARAVIAAEDANFCTHRGFDVEAIEKAMAANEASGRLRGASTISQQTAKNAFLWPDRSWLRKGLEAWFTVLIEAIWGKARILEVYLNIAEWGRGIYGAEAASRHYFGKAARDLTRAEAARLAAILPQPLKRDAARPGPFTQRYAATIQARMRVVANEGLDACVR